MLFDSSGEDLGVGDLGLSEKENFCHLGDKQVTKNPNKLQFAISLQLKIKQICSEELQEDPGYLKVCVQLCGAHGALVLRPGPHLATILEGLIIRRV